MTFAQHDGLDLWSRTVVATVRSDAPDLTARQQALLLTVALGKGLHTVRGLAEHLCIAKPAVTRGLDALEKMGFVRRIPDERDLRSILIERTQSGMDYLRNLAAAIQSASDAKGADVQLSGLDQAASAA